MELGVDIITTKTGVYLKKSIMLDASGEMARKRQKASAKVDARRKKQKNPTGSGRQKRSNRYRNPNIDSRFSLLVHGLATHGIRTLIVRPMAPDDASPVIARELETGIYKLSPEKIKAGRWSTFTHHTGPQNEMALRGYGSFLGMEISRHRKTDEDKKTLADKLVEMGIVLPAYLRLFGEDVSHVEVPPWKDCLDGMKATGLFVVAKQLGYASASINLTASMQAKILSSKNGPAPFLQNLISRKLRDAGLKGAQFAFVIDTNLDGKLHVHGCIGGPNISFGKLIDRKRVRAALRAVSGEEKRGVCIKMFSRFPEGFGGYSSKYSLITREEIASSGKTPKILLKTKGLTAEAASWWDSQRESNLADLIEQTAIQKGLVGVPRDLEAERLEIAKHRGIAQAAAKAFWARQAALGRPVPRKSPWGRPTP